MVYTVGALRAFQMGAEEINAAGGALGRPIEIIVRDSKGVPVRRTEVRPRAR